METWTILLEILELLSAAMVLGIIFERLGQSSISGYLIAGTLLGPGFLNVVQNQQVVDGLAELGVALLLFTIGLEFSWQRLKSFGAVGVGGGALQLTLTTLAAAAMGSALGMRWDVSLAVGLMIGPSSTACVLRVLRDRSMLDGIHGRHALGILLLQDAALAPLVLLMVLLGGKGTPVTIIFDFAVVAGSAIGLVALFYALINYAFPRLLSAVVATRNRELFVLIAATTSLGAAWAAHAVNLSPALGAFFAGMILAESPFATQIRADVTSFRTLFVTVFFASVGMLADLQWIGYNLLPVLALTAALIAGKAAIVWAVLIGLRSTVGNALATGVTLAQVGEFSFVLSGVGAAHGLIDQTTLRLLLSATVLSLFITPALVMYAPRLGRFLDRTLSEAREPLPTGGHAELGERPTEGHLIVVGFGPAGEKVADALKEEGFLVLVLDLNPRLVAQAKELGLFAEVGDASLEATLTHANVERALAVVVTLPDPHAAHDVIGQVRSLAPKTRVFARARWNRYVDTLKHAGAEVSMSEEELVGRELGAEVVSRLT